MGKWEIEYYDEGESGFMPFLPAEIDQVYFEHEGEPYATFFINNTTANQALIQQDLLVNIYFDSVLQFTGILQGGDLEAKPTKILATVVDDLFLTLDKATPISGIFAERHGAKVILDIILAGTGYTSDAGTPTTVIPVVFYHANRLDCMAFLRKALNMDFWHVGTVVHFGTEGAVVTHTPATTDLTISKRALSRRKQYDKVEVRGVDSYGYHIVGSAGTGSRVKVINETEVADATTLNTIAARKLAELTTDSAGLPISVPIWVGKSYALGNSVTIVNARYLLNGTYHIRQLTKTKTKVSMQLDNFRKPLDATVDELKNWEDRGIYTPGSTSWSVNLQGLLGLFHLNEGSGTEAKNKAPIETPIDGVITDGSWEDGPITKMLTFNGSSSMVSLGDDSKTGINFTSKLSFGGWFSPSDADSTERNVCHKSGQFGLHYHSNTGVVTATITISSTVHSFNSDAGVATVGARLFVMCTYDGANVKMYVNGYLHKQWSQTGNPDSSANIVYLGVFLKGVLAEVMFWSRALVDQEVLELYFFPLFRVVGNAGSSSSPPSSDPDFELAPTPNIGVLAVPHIWGVPVPILTESVKVNPDVDGLGNKTIHETLSESVKVNPDVDGNHNKTIHGNLVESVRVNPDVDGSGNKTIHDSMTESVAVTKAPANWFACIIVFPNNRCGDVTPLGSQTIASGTGLTVIATENLGDFFGFFNWIVDGVFTLGTMNLLSNTNTLSVSAKPAGTTHQIQAYFGYGWSLTSSVLSGPGSIDKVGTDVIPPGQNSTVYTATPTPNPGDPTHPNLFEGWYLDGIKVSSSSTCVVGNQTSGTNHTLRAHFTNWWGVG